MRKGPAPSMHSSRTPWHCSAAARQRGSAAPSCPPGLTEAAGAGRQLGQRSPLDFAGGPGRFDAVSCMFALHYFFETEEVAPARARAAARAAAGARGRAP